ncbi:MAG: Crp/Fnr family transcriptional regulator [Saprospiraceae bacterium]|nr:Crp/Fnr family transcriptional regulator [Saprospiraceae bacterium]
MAEIEAQFNFLFEPELLAEINEVAEVGTFEADTIIMEIGQRIDALPLIISGSIKVMSEDEKGNELLLYYLETGDTCAMTMQCCTGTKRSKIRALTEEVTTLAMVPAQKLHEWMIKYQSWRSFILENYDHRLSEMLEAIDNLAFHNMEERLYKYLRDKAMVTHSAEIKMTHYQIANDLNSSRVVISRLLKKLDQDGKVKHHRNLIEVCEFIK